MDEEETVTVNKAALRRVTDKTTEIVGDMGPIANRYDDEDEAISALALKLADLVDSDDFAALEAAAR